MSHKHYALVLLAVFILFWIVMAISPLDRHDWLFGIVDNFHDPVSLNLH